MSVQENLRQLISFVLEAHEAAGRTLHIPVGCTGSEPWLLDSLDVPALLALIRQGHPVQLSKLCKSGSGPSQPSSARAASDVTSWTYANGPDAPPSAGSFTAGGPAQDSAEAGEAGASNANEPVLDLPSLETGLKEYELKDLAYTVFVGACGRGSHPELTRTVCNQLDMSESRAAEMQQAMEASPSNRTPAFSRHAATLKLQAELLQTVRPGHFSSFRAFVMWRQTSGRLMAQVLSRALQSTPGLEWSNRNGRPRFAVAHLQGALRRLDVRNPDEFVEAEYAVAAKDFVAAASDIASHCSSGWRFPWAVRVRVADLLLRGLFESDDSGSYVEDRTALLSLLEKDLWPLLGISPQVHAALYAWIHFRQFALTGRRSLLVATQQLIANLLSESGRRTSGASREEASGDEALDSQFGADVAAAVEAWILKRMQDYHQAFAGDAILMAGLLEVLIAAELCKGRNAAVHRMLEGCVAASLDAQMGRLHAQAATSSGEDSADQLHRLARYTHRILKVESEMFTPVLSEHLPLAGAVAAAHLHRAFGSVFLPWLLTVDSLDESTLTTVRAADGLEAALNAHARLRPSMSGGPGADGTANGASQRGDGGVVPDMPAWDTLHRMAPLLFHWVQSQLAQLGAWTSRILESESWQPISPSRLLSR
ncbi:hypothetical protein WJX84_003269 [Apatococcus fuscideae]|uniref:Uncharacterized protein n=1 Tax=Apatococcus fuscideae TaxID=2026836 RepID=A0AAW1SPQ0_9CHLO